MISTTPPETRPPERLLGGERPPWRQRLSRADLKISPYLYVSPFFILFAIVGAFPLLYTGYVALHQWHLIGGEGKFVGLENFQYVLGQEYFWRSLRNTLSIFVLSSVPQVIFALLIAAALDSNLRGRTWWRMGVLLPYVIAPVAVALIFNDLFGDRYGLINQILGTVGIDPIAWHKDVIPSHLAIATMVNFRWTGYNALIFLAAMQAIPRDYYEAAQIDGAGWLRQFRSITIPSLRATIIFVVITSTIGGLQIFDEPRMYDQYGMGGADRQWQTLTIYLYQVGWTQKNFGRAAAIAWLLFLIILLIGVVNYFIARRISSKES